jgi:long-chain fatty acid transport protein
MKLSKKLIITASMLLASQSQAIAAGYSTSLYSTSGLATSYAGSAAGSHDVSDMFFNPAITSDIKTRQFIASVSYLDLKIDPYQASYNGAGGTRERDAGKNAFVPSFYLSSPLSKSTTFALAVTSPFGLATDYNPSWAGSSTAVASSIKTTNVNPTLSYKLTDKLAVAAGFQAQFMETALTKNIPGLGMVKVKGDDWGYGYNLGAHYKINDKAKVGIGYRSHIKHELNGATGAPAAGISVGSNLTMLTPESLTIGGSFKLNKKLELLSDISWTRWSRLNNANVTFDSVTALGTNDNTRFHFQDSFMYSLGANYTFSEKTLLRFGTAYEQGGVRDSSREARIPAGDRIWASIGFNYKVNKTLSFDAAYLHQFHRATTIRNEGGLNAKYRASVDAFSLGLKKDF